MLIILVKSQSTLFDAPVQVSGSVRKDGTLVAPHTRIQKIAIRRPAPAAPAHQQHALFDEPAKAPAPTKRTKLDAFIAKHGGERALARTLATMTEGQQRQLLEAMGKLSGQSVEDVADRFAGHWDKPPEKGETPDLFADAPAEPAPRMVDADEHGEVPPGRVARREPKKPDPDVIAPVDEAPPSVPVPDVKAAPGTFGVPAGISKAERRAINSKVVALVQDGQTDSDLMRQYSGNGGCGDSLNEFYTDPEIASAMWQVVHNLGITSGAALEPSCATGVFLHTAPTGFRVTGVEMDPISQACAVALHGDRHEIMPAQSLERFARSDGGRQFKVVIGNPPYGPRGSLAKDDKRTIKSAEAYFIDTSLDKCEAGGVVALVVPASVMNNKNGRAFRERMLRKAEFLGAQRMPNTAFEASHTDVTADIIWLRKRPDDVAGALMTVDKDTLKKLAVWDEEFLAGSYFEGRGAENLFGRAGKAMRAFGEIYTVDGSMAGVPQRIAEFKPHPIGSTPTVSDIVEAAGGDESDGGRRALGGAMVRPYADGKAGDTKTVDGITYVLQGKPLRWHRVDEMMEHEAITDAKPIAAELERLLTSGGVGNADLQAQVEAWVARHGIPIKNQHLVQAADHDRTLHRLIGAVDRTGRLSDAVTGRRAERIEGSVETAASTLAAERNTGTFTVAELAARSGRAEDGLDELLHAGTGYAYAGGGQWTTMDQYLTGELWPKLDAVRAAMAQPDLDAGIREKYELQARRLDETIAPKSLEDVEVMLNSAFLPTRVIEAWLDSRVETLRAEQPTSQYYRDLKPSSVVFEGGIYTVSGGTFDGSLLEKYLNRTGVRQDDRPTIDRMNEEFKAWLLTSSIRDDVEELYNRKFRGFVERQWSDAPIDIPGLNTEGGTRTPNDYHWSSLRWALHQGKGIIADDVGLGKTLRGLMLARLAKMNGQAQKPTFVVPKSVLANWVAEVDMWFPGSRVLVIGESYSRDKAGNLKSKPDTAEERNRKYHDLTQNDYDFVFISQPAFNELDVDPITKGQYLGDDFWVQRGEKLGNAGDKKIRRAREQYEQATADREFGKRTDAIYFNHLPVDMLIVDEGHAYKNLYAAKARFGEAPKFLGGQGQSNRAFDMGFKAKWLREKNGGKGIFTLTATPTKNSPLEIYSMLSYIAPEEFERLGIRNSEEFLDRYCEFKTDKILGTNGVIDDGLVTSGFKNLDELREIMARYIMRRTAKDVGLKLPTVSDETHLVDMSPKQAEVYGELRAQLAEVGKKDATGDAHVFSIMDKMAKAALDLELLDGSAYGGQKSLKYAEVAKVAAERRKDGGQVVFCEAVDSHEKIAAAMVAAGIPRERIGIMNAQAASSSAARQNLSDKFNSGALDVIIGNKVMEEGVNLQKRTSDIHHLDIPWDPATMQQRNGRGVRQGNKSEGVRLHAYLTRGSFDGYRYQSMRAKRDWMETLWNGADRVENLAREGVISREDMMIAMSADPEAEREKMANDKAAALERHNAEKRVDAVKVFVRFQEMSRSFKGLRNKDTDAGRRLRMQIERAKTSLASNPHFKAKGALDSNDEVLIHPGSGDVVHRDMGMDVSERDGTTQRWVVTGVDPVKQTVSMRMYADTTGHRGVTVPLMKLADGVKPFTFDKAAEAAEVGKKMNEAAQAQLNSIDDYDAVMKMPSAVLEANHDLIQRQLKEGVKAYKIKNMPGYGKQAVINRETGAVELKDHYDMSKLGDTHDFLLPTDANKEKLERAWIESRRNSRLGTRLKDAGKKRRGYSSGGGDWEKIREYKDADYGNRAKNPYSDPLTRVHGQTIGYGTDSPAVKAAKAKLSAEQMTRIRQAKSMDDVLGNLMPLASPGGGYPERALAMAWAKARQFGSLGQRLRAHVETSGGYPSHASHAYGGADRDAPIHQALVQMALGSGHKGLAAAMSESGIRHKVLAGDHTVVAQKEMAARFLDARLSSSGPVRYRLTRAAMAHAEAGGFADDQKPRNAGTGYYWGNPETWRAHISKILADEAPEATKEAA